MKDELFGELTFEGYSWDGKIKTEIFDDEFVLMVQSEDESQTVTDAQRAAYKAFADNAQQLLPQMLDGMAEFYNDELKHSYGGDDMWADIDTPEQLLEHITPDALIVPYDNIAEDFGSVYLTFLCDWEQDQAEQSGIAVEIANGEIEQINTADIAF